MSLLENSAYDAECVIMDKQTRPNGIGGIITDWVEGAHFNASIQKHQDMQARIAEKEGVTSLYDIITSRAIVLNFGDVIKRLEDNTTFKITSNGIDKTTPDGSSLDMRVVTAEVTKI